MQQKDILIEIYGWYGAVGLLVGYVLSSMGLLSVESAWYQALNITAAIGIVCVSFHKKAYQPGILNIVWAVVAAIALIQIIK